MAEQKRGPGRPRKNPPAEQETVLVGVMHPFWLDGEKQPVKRSDGKQNWVSVAPEMAAHLVRHGLAMEGPDV